MAHLVIGKRTSFKKLAELHKKYEEQRKNAIDPFEKREVCLFLTEIFVFCMKRGGMEYWKKVKNEIA